MSFGGGDDDSAEQAQEQEMQEELDQEKMDQKMKNDQLQSQRINAIRRGTGGQSLFGPSSDNLKQLLGG